MQSSFVSNQGYGFFLNTSALSLWNLDDGRPEQWQAQNAEPSIEYVVAPGPMSRAVSEAHLITGRQRVPAQWFLGPLFDREVEEPIETAAKYENRSKRTSRTSSTTNCPSRPTASRAGAC